MVVEKALRALKRIVAAEVVAGAVQVVGARLGRDRDDGRQRRAVLRVELVAEHLELLHRILADVHRRVAPDGIVQIAAVDDGGVAVALIGRSAELHARELADVVGRGAWHGLGERQEVALEHRQGLNLILDDRRRRRRPCHLDQGRLGRHRDALFERRHPQPQIERHVGADRQHQFALRGAKAGELDRNEVGRRLQRDEPIDALGAGDDDLLSAVRLVQRRDRRAGKDAAVLVA